MSGIRKWLTFGVFYLVFKWAIRLASVVLVPKQQRLPSAALGWLLFIVLFPIPGLLLYLLVGSSKLSAKRRQQQRFVNDTVQLLMNQVRADPARARLIAPELPMRYASVARLLEQLGGLPVFQGNAFELLPDYDCAVQRIIEDIDHAERYVHVEYFIFADDGIGGPVIDALIRAHQRGVKVRVLIDHVGNFQFNKPVFTRLRGAGVAVREMLPVRVFDNEWSRLDLRNHRKIVVVDGTSGFTGSQNLIERDYHKRANIRKGLYYEELVARVTGPVVVQLGAAFAADWYSETGDVLERGNFPELAVEWGATGDALAQVLPSGRGEETENNWLLFNALFHQAQQKIVIATPYFVPDVTLRTAIVTAARRGVDVTLIVSGIADQFLVSRVQRSNYEELLAAGVKIRLFDPPILLHSKHMTIDDDICVIGSSNMDMRSFLLDLEVSLVVYDRSVVAALGEVDATYMARSHELTAEEWARRSFGEKFVQNTSRLMSEFV
jgi:cardiolipin synthase